MDVNGHVDLEEENGYVVVDSCSNGLQAMVETASDSTVMLKSLLDVVNVKANSLLEQLNEAAAREGGQHSSIRTCIQTASQLMMMLEVQVQNQTIKTMNAMRALLHLFIKDPNNCTDLEFTSSKTMFTDYQDLAKQAIRRESTLQDRLLIEKERLRKQVVDLTEYNKELDRKEETFMKEKSTLNSNLKWLKETLKTEEVKKAQLNSANEEMRKEIICLKKSESNLKADIESKEKQIDDLKEKYEAFKIERNKVEETLEKELDSLNCTRELLENELKNANETGERLQGDLINKDNELKRLNEHSRQMEHDFKKRIDELGEERDSLVKSCNELSREIDSKSNESKRQTSRIKDLENNVQGQKNIISDRDQHITSLQEEMKEQKTNLSSCISQLELEKAALIENKHILENDITGLKNGILELNADLEKRLKNISKLEDTNKELTNTCYRKSEQIDHLTKNLIQEEDKVTKLEDNITEIQEKRSRDQKHAADVQEKLHGSIELLKIEKEAQRENIKLLEEQNETMEHKIANLESQIDALKEDCNKLKEELNFLNSKRVMKVQLFFQHRTDLSSIVEVELAALLREKLESDTLKLDFLQCAKSSDIQIGLPVLILCITASRLGTDVHNAIQGLQLNSNMAVVIFHHKDVHALPKQASDRVLTGGDFKCLGVICDLAFLSGKGIYHCNMNQDNIISLVRFVDKEGIKESITETRQASTLSQ